MKYLTLALATLATLAAAGRADDLPSDSRRIKSTETDHRPARATKTNLEPDGIIKEYLKKFRADCVGSLLNGRPEPIVGYFAESVRLMPEYQKTVLGKTNAFSYYKTFLARFVVRSYSREEIEAIDLGSRVLEIGRVSTKLALKTTGQEHEIPGKYLDIWEKSEHGRLTLITQCWNYDQPLEIADELRFADVPAVQMALQPHLPVKDRISFELAALNKLLEAAVSQHDGKLWAQFFADDAVLMANYSPVNRGRKAVDEYIENHVKYLPIFEKLDIRNDRIDDLGYYVIEYATHVANWRNGESSGVSTGKNIRVWQREPEGSLKLFLQIGGYD